MADKLYIREATLDDYNDVMDIGNMLNGRDYLPALYSEYLKRFKCFVGMINGEVVAFNGGRLIDDGKTLTNAASRVKDSFRGQGILAAMMKHVYQVFKDSPSLVREAFTTNNVNMAENGARILKKYTTILEKSSIEYVCYPEDLKVDGYTDKGCDGVQTLDESGLKWIFGSPESSNLFPDNRIVAFFYPFRIYPQNIPLILDGKAVYVSKLNDVYVVISICKYFCTPSKWLRYNIDLYGSDKEHIRKHLVKHMLNIKHYVLEKEYENIVLHITFTENTIEQSFIADVFKKFGLMKVDSEINRIYLFEKDII